MYVCTTEELQGMNISVLGPIYPDDSEEEAPSPLQIALLFRDKHVLPSQPLSLKAQAVTEWYNNIV